MSGIDPNRSGVLVVGGGGASLSDATPQPTGTAAAGVSTSAARADHVHAAAVASTNLTDAGAAGIAVVQSSTAAAAATALAERTTYAFGSSTGVTLTNRNGTAAISGGVLTLSSTVRADHFTATLNSPSASVSLALADGRYPQRVRARARIVSMSLGGVTTSQLVAYLDLSTADATPQRYSCAVLAEGEVFGERNDSGPTSAGSSGAGVAAAAIAGGTLVLEAEACGGRVAFRYSLDSGTTWADLGTVRTPDGAKGWATAQLHAGVTDAPSGTASIVWDDLVVERWP